MLNPVKAFSRLFYTKPLSSDSNKNEYMVLSQKNAIGLKNREKVLSSHVPDMGGHGFIEVDYSMAKNTSPNELFGYHMPLKMRNHIICHSKAYVDRLPNHGTGLRECHAKRGLKAFRSVLRGEPFDLSYARLGATMILECDKVVKGGLPKELHELAYRLWSAGARIHMGNPPAIPRDGVVVGEAHPSAKYETGDVAVKKSPNGRINFFTKPIYTHKTRFGILAKKSRPAPETEYKLRAAYQSLYHAVSGAKNVAKQQPDILYVFPLLRVPKGDGSVMNSSASAARKHIDITMGEAVRHLVMNGGEICFKSCDNGENFDDAIGESLLFHYPYRGEIGKWEAEVSRLKSMKKSDQDSKSFDLDATQSDLDNKAADHAEDVASNRRDDAVDSSSDKPRREDSSENLPPVLLKPRGKRVSKERTYKEESEARGSRRSVGERLSSDSDESSSSGITESAVEESEGSSKSDDALSVSLGCVEVTAVIGRKKQEALLDIGASGSGSESDSSNYSSDKKANRTSWLPSSVGGGQFTVQDGRLNSIEKRSIRVDPVHYKKAELNLPDLASSSDSESIYVKNRVKKMVKKYNKEKNPIRRNEKLSAGSDEAGKKSVIGRGADRVHDFFNKKSKMSKKGFEMTGNIIIVGDKHVVAGQYQPGEALAVGRPSPDQVSPAKTAEHEVEKYQTLLQTGAHSFLASWTKISESTEVDAYRLAEDVELFSRSIEDFLSSVSDLESRLFVEKAGIEALKKWARNCSRHMSIIGVDLLSIYMQRDEVSDEETQLKLKEQLGSFMKVLEEVIQ